MRQQLQAAVTKAIKCIRLSSLNGNEKPPSGFLTHCFRYTKVTLGRMHDHDCLISGARCSLEALAAPAELAVPFHPAAFL